MRRFVKFKVFLLVCMAPGADAQSSNERLEFVASLPTQLHETSGLAFDNNILWTLNDSGNEAAIFSLSRTGKLLKSVDISNAKNVDWESIAIDDNYLYISDTGNNFNTREKLVIYRVPIPSPITNSINAEVIELQYADRKSGNPRAHNFDAEALTTYKSELWLFTKNRDDQQTNLYRFPKKPGSYTVKKAQTLPLNSLVTGADINVNTGELALVSYSDKGSKHGVKVWFAPTSDSGVGWSKHKVLTLKSVDQWEAITWIDHNKLMLTHEKSRVNSARLAILKTPF